MAMNHNMLVTFFIPKKLIICLVGARKDLCPHSLRSNINISISIDTLNKLEERQDKTIYTYMNNIQEVLTRIQECIQTDKMCTYCSMNKQYMIVQKW